MANTTTTNGDISCKQRLVMIFFPCGYLCNPKLFSNDCCLCCHETPLHDIVSIPPLIEMSGTWITTKPIPLCFLFIRFLFALVMIYITVLNFGYFIYHGHTIYWIMYFAIWPQLLATILMIIKSISTYKVYKSIQSDAQSELEKRIDNSHKLWKLYVIQSILLQTVLPIISMIVFNYFVFVYDGKFESTIDMIDSIQLHGVNCFILWFDFLFSMDRMYYKACLWPIVLWIIYTICTIIFALFINVNEKSDTYLYSIFDWFESMKPIIYCISTFFNVSVWVVLSTFIKNIILICCTAGKYKYNFVNTDDTDASAMDALL
eukprot:386195_1